MKHRYVRTVEKLTKNKSIQRSIKKQLLVSRMNGIRNTKNVNECEQISPAIIYFS